MNLSKKTLLTAALLYPNLQQCTPIRTAALFGGIYVFSFAGAYLGAKHGEERCLRELERRLVKTDGFKELAWPIKVDEE